VPEGRFVIEVGPPWANGATTRGVVAQGQVGARWAGRFPIFRYEVRRWRNGVIPDIGEAVDSPRRLSDDVHRARLLLDIVPLVPIPVWGRDELGTGDMWNSNSVISWLLVGSGLPTEAIRPPRNGRAPGWEAGLVVARREQLSSSGGRTQSELGRATAGAQLAPTASAESVDMRTSQGPSSRYKRPLVQPSVS
jgi:hypothetical protein